MLLDLRPLLLLNKEYVHLLRLTVGVDICCSQCCFFLNLHAFSRLFIQANTKVFFTVIYHHKWYVISACFCTGVVILS